MARIKGEVKEWCFQELYANHYDSVFLVKLTEPTPQELFFNAQSRLVKINIPEQKMRIYLDVVRQDATPEEAYGPSFGVREFFRLLPNYMVYLVIGLIWASLLAGRWYSRSLSHLALAAGAAAFLVVALIQLPIQRYLFMRWYVPSLADGGLAIVPALAALIPAGLVQEGLKLLGVWLFGRSGRITGSQFAVAGALFGAGLGMVEACYLDSVVPGLELFSWSLVERAFMLLFHSTSGALIGWSWAARGRVLVVSLSGLVLANTGLRCLPLFVQQGVLPVEVTTLVLAVVVLLTVIITLLLMKKRG